MIELPAVRWGASYESIEVDEFAHFPNSEPVALDHAIDAQCLKLGATAALQLDWLRPHVSNLIEFLYRNRALPIAR